MLGVHETMRPSAFVVPENFGAVEEVEGNVEVEEWRVRVTGMFAPGRPSVVSRTWHVIGGFFSAAVVVVVDIVGCCGERLGGVERWFERAFMRCVVDMR